MFRLRNLPTLALSFLVHFGPKWGCHPPYHSSKNIFWTLVCDDGRKNWQTALSGLLDVWFQNKTKKLLFTSSCSSVGKKISSSWRWRFPLHINCFRLSKAAERRRNLITMRKAGVGWERCLTWRGRRGWGLTRVQRAPKPLHPAYLRRYDKF